MKTISILYPLPVSRVFQSMKDSGFQREKISLLSEVDQTFYKGQYFSFVYTVYGEALLIISNDTPESFKLACKEVLDFMKSCKLPVSGLHEESSVPNHKGFIISLDTLLSHS